MALPDSKGITIAEALVTRVFCVLGVPREILTDNAPNLLHGALEEVRSLMGVHRIKIHAYTPSNNIVERSHVDLVRVLAKICDGDQETLSKWVPMAQYCHNHMENRSTGQTPHYAMFLRRGHFPTSQFLDDPAPYYNFGDEYVRDMLHRLKRVYAAMVEASEVAVERRCDG